jgi:hypothetical protein
MEEYNQLYGKTLYPCAISGDVWIPNQRPLTPKQRGLLWRAFFMMQTWSFLRDNPEPPPVGTLNAVRLLCLKHGR